MMTLKNNFVKILAVVVGLFLLNMLGNKLYKRFDLTKDKRYTLSQSTKTIIANIDAPIIIDILLEGNFPSEFKRLQSETKQLLEEFSAVNNNIKFNFVNPLEDETTTSETIAKLQSLGLMPTQVTAQENGKVSQEFVFPWAIANSKDKSVKIPLLKNKIGSSSEERSNNSIQNLEYAFADGLHKLTNTQKKKVAILKGNGELPDVYMADFLTTIRDYYNIAPFTLDSVATNAEKTLQQLHDFDLAIVAKPTKPFTEEQKFVLDQYIMNGGKMVWMLDQVAMEVDSLFNETGTSIALPIDLNLTDMLFKYGVRVNPSLVNDLYFTEIVLASGEGNNSQYNPIPWFYNPMVLSKNNHPINNNIEAVRLQFTNPIDTLSNGIKKTVLLQSSPLSKTEGTPATISLDIATKEPEKETYTHGNVPLGVLLEGSFTSAYKNRVHSLKALPSKEQSKNTAMVIIADGDIVKNQLRNGRPLELGYDKWTNKFYGNKEFLLNTLNYLLDDSGIINVRTKKVNIAFLDAQKLIDEKTKWQLVNVALPLIFFVVFGIAYNYMRKRKYAA